MFVTHNKVSNNPLLRAVNESGSSEITVARHPLNQKAVVDLPSGSLSDCLIQAGDK